MVIKKSKKKRPQLRTTATTSRRSPAKSNANKLTRKKAGAKKKISAKKSSASRAASATRKSSPKKTTPKKAAAGKAKARPTKPAVQQSQSLDTESLELQQRRSRAAGQSGDLQGLSGSEGADSESVDELLEEGNSFEAGVVAGVQEADDNEKEIRTREVLEDDVPGEYLDKD